MGAAALSGWATTLRSLGVLLFAALCARAVLLGGLTEVRYAEDWRPPGAVHTVEVDADRGDLEVRAGEELRVAREALGPPGALNLRHEVIDGTLRLSGRCRAYLGCAVRHQLTLPPGVRLRVRLGEGQARVEGVEALQLQISRGSAEVLGAALAEITVGEGTLSVQSASPAGLDLVVARGELSLQLPSGTWPVQAAGAPLSVSGLTIRPVQPGDPALSARAPGGALRVWAEADPAPSTAPSPGAAAGPPW